MQLILEYKNGVPRFSSVNCWGLFGFDSVERRIGNILDI